MVKLQVLDCVDTETVSIPSARWLGVGGPHTRLAEVLIHQVAQPAHVFMGACSPTRGPHYGCGACEGPPQCSDTWSPAPAFLAMRLTLRPGHTFLVFENTWLWCSRSVHVPGSTRSREAWRTQQMPHPRDVNLWPCVYKAGPLNPERCQVVPNPPKWTKTYQRQPCPYTQCLSFKVLLEETHAIACAHRKQD